jgi:hypothetical protein
MEHDSQPKDLLFFRVTLCEETEITLRAEVVKELRDA